ncbi:MAG: hypothetical protein ACI8TP_003585 [Acidimicrobiales bacterium]|jgi:hypothetical protein
MESRGLRSADFPADPGPVEVDLVTIKAGPLGPAFIVVGSWRACSVSKHEGRGG